MINPAEIERILVINLASVSEVILTVPVTRALKEFCPEARLSMLSVPAAASVLEMNPFVDDVLLYDKHGEQQGVSGLIGIVNMLRRERFDLAVCLNESVRGAFAVWAAGIRYRLGYDRVLNRILLSHTVSLEEDRIRHRAMQLLDVLLPLKVLTEDISLTLQLDEKTEKIVDTTIFLDNARPKVAFFPFDSAYPKCSPSEEKSRTIIAELSAFADVYLIGGMAEKAVLQQMAEDSGLPPERVLAGKLNLKEIAVLLKQMSLLLTVESSVMYMAQAFGIPVVALFGPHDAQVYGPFGNRDLVLSHQMPCRPCHGKISCAVNDCIEEIPLKEIIAHVKARVEANNDEN